MHPNLRTIPAFVTILAALLSPAAALAASSATPVASPAAGVTSETLCTAVLPASSIPFGDVFVDFFRTTLLPETALEFPADFLVPGAGIDCAESGSYTVRSEGPLAIDRGGAGGSEMVEPGTETAVRAGDTVIILDNDHPQTYQVTGGEPAVIVTTMILSTEPPECAPNACPTYPAGALSNSLGSLSATGWSDSGLQDQDLQVTLRRITLPPGASMPASPETWPTLRFVEAGTLTWAIQPSSLATPRGELEAREGAPVPHFKPTEGSQVVISNDGSDPATYLELTITPVEE